MDESLQETRTTKHRKTSDSPVIPAAPEILAICKLLEEHKAVKVIALDLRALHLWTDFFIISTVSSSAHLQGLLRHIKEFTEKEGITVQHHTQREESGGWNLVDLGTAVIHLMTAQSREFYELEELWSSAGVIYP